MSLFWHNKSLYSMCIALLIYVLKFTAYYLEHRLLSGIKNYFILKFSHYYFSIIGLQIDRIFGLPFMEGNKPVQLEKKKNKTKSKQTLTSTTRIYVSFEKMPR